MAKRHFELTATQVGQLRQREQQTRDRHELKRLQAVRLYGSRISIRQIMDMLTCGESSIREWVHKYQQGGLSGLQSQWDGQNARKVSVEQQQDLATRLGDYRPDQVLASDQLSGTGQFWTVDDLRQVVAQWYGVTYQDDSSYRQLLHRCGFSYQRAERVYKSRPSAVTIADFELELEKK